MKLALRLMLAASLLHQSAFAAVGAACAIDARSASPPTPRRCQCCRVPSAGDLSVGHANPRPCCGAICRCGQRTDGPPLLPAPARDGLRTDELLPAPAATATSIRIEEESASGAPCCFYLPRPIFGLALHRALCIWHI